MQQRSRCAPVAAAGCDADAGRDDDRSAAELERLRERGERALGDHRCVDLGSQGLGDNGELVTAEAPDDVATADGRAQPLGDLRQEAVASFVTDAVVDLLEGVDVEEQHRQVLV